MIAIRGRRRAAAVTMVAALALAVTGCGSSDDAGASADAGSSSDGGLGDLGGIVDPSASASEASAGASTDDAEASPSASSSSGIEFDTTDAEQNCPDLADFATAGQDQTEKMLQGMSDLYSSFVIRAVCPGTIAYEYTFRKQLDASSAKPSLQQQTPTLKSTCETTLFPQMKAAGITDDLHVSFTYDNADGSEIFSYTCDDS